MNRKISIAILLLLFALAGIPGSYAQEVKKTEADSKIKWYSFEEAYQIQKKDKKPKKMFIDMYTDWCGWCKTMDNQTFSHPEIAEYMSKNFYCVKFNAERKDTITIDGQVFVNPNPKGSRSTHKLAVELLRGRLSYPSFVFLNEKGQSITVVAGFQKPKEFEKVLNYFGSDAYLKKTFDEFKVDFTGKVQQ